MKRTQYSISKNREMPWKEGIRGKESPQLMITLPLDKETLQKIFSTDLRPSSNGFTVRASDTILDYCIDAFDAEYFSAEIFGVHALFTYSKIIEGTLPRGVYRYELRNITDKDGNAFLISTEPLPGCLGTLVSTEPLHLGENGWSILSEDALDWMSRVISLTEYLRYGM